MFFSLLLSIVFLQHSAAFISHATTTGVGRTAFSSASSLSDHKSSFVFQPLLDAIAVSPVTSTTNSTETFRVFHGRGGCFLNCEHLTLDWFPPVWVLTSFQNKPLSSEELMVIGTALQDRWNDDESPVAWVYQSRGTQAKVNTTIMAGTIPDPHVVTENESKYLVQVAADDTGRKHRGLFLDMANGRKWVKENSRNKTILNLFSYTCGFSVAALAQPDATAANEVINMDKVAGVLKLGQRNHELNNIPRGKARFFSHDIFKSWGKLRRLGPFDLIIVDPPSYQKGSFVASKDYGKLIRRLPGLLTETGGQVLLCLNAPELGMDFLQDQVTENAPELEFVMQLPNPDSFPTADADRGLKVLLYKMDGVDMAS